MAIQDANYHRDNFRLTQALGDKLFAAEATMAPTGFESLYLLIKQFPHPILSGGEVVESAVANGGSMWQQQQPDFKFQGPFAIYETVTAAARQFFRDVLSAGGYFDARIYEGSPDRHTRSYLIERASVKLDLPDRDGEARGQLLVYTGTISFHYFGEERPGNI